MPERPGLPRQCAHTLCTGGVCEVNFGTCEFRITSLAAPLQIEGRIDGVRFYFRERHNRWRLEAHPDTPHEVQVGGAETDDLTVGEAVELIQREMSAWIWSSS